MVLISSWCRNRSPLGEQAQGISPSVICGSTPLLPCGLEWRRDILWFRVPSPLIHTSLQLCQSLSFSLHTYKGLFTCLISLTLKTNYPHGFQMFSLYINIQGLISLSKIISIARMVEIHGLIFLLVKETMGEGNKVV